ncbi:hypothetical protein M0805_007358 [Coniferiporia weirii]|nr:hypothetical protein M0805_007358 [Coniferiporia weirii]
MSSSPPSLLVPPHRPSRARASSTGVRPPLSIATLEPRSQASSSSVSVVPLIGNCTSSPTGSCVLSSDVSPSQQSSSFALPSLSQPRNRSQDKRDWPMFPVLVSRTVDLWRALRFGPTGKHGNALFASPSSSPRSSTDTDYILPLSASSQKTSFDVVDLAPPPHIRAHFRLPTIPSAHASLLLVIVLFPLSTAITFLCLSTLPITFAWPRTLSDLAQLGRDLNNYSQSGFIQTAHILGVLSVSAIWKHAWSVPGSVLWNVLAGALFHPLLATLLMTLLTTIGSLFSTLLATPLAPILTRLFPRPVELTRAALEGSSFSRVSVEFKPLDFPASSSSEVRGSTPAWVRLSVLRLVGVVPWSGLNIACGLTGVALRDCIAGSFIGCLPWTAVTCQIGDIIQILGAASSGNATMDGAEGLGEGFSKSATLSSVLAQPQIVFELIFLSVLSLAPILGRKRLRRLISATGSHEDAEDEKKETVASTNGPNISKESERETEGSMYLDKCDRRGRRDYRQRWTWKRLSMSVPRWSALNSPIRQSFSKDERDVRQ